MGGRGRSCRKVASASTATAKTARRHNSEAADGNETFAEFLERKTAESVQSIHRHEDSLVPPSLTANEARLIGCLMEKSIVTPDQYPLTLNSLTNACNQKSGRNPVTSLDPGLVQRTARELGAKHFVIAEENFKSGVVKFKQRLCNTTHSDYQFDPPQFAIVCLLLLRGPQTPGELRAHSGRLHTFADNAAVLEALADLIEREGQPLVVKLPRTPGRKDSEYMHLLSGPIDVEPHAAQGRETKTVGTADRVSLSELTQRVAKLEAEVAGLKAQLAGTA